MTKVTTYLSSFFREGMSQQEQLTRLSEILTSEESDEQDEFLETLKTIPSDVVHNNYSF